MTKNFPLKTSRRILLASITLTSMGFMALFPILAPLGRETGLSEVQITSIIGASSLTMFLMGPFWGRLSDRVGRKKMIIFGCLGFAGTTTIFNLLFTAAFAGLLVGIPLFVCLVVSRVSVTAFSSACFPAATAYMADITSTQERTKGMGLVGAASNIGSIFGPALAVLAFISILTPLWVITALVLLNGIFVLKYLPQSPYRQVRNEPLIKVSYFDKRILPFIAVGVLMFMGNALVIQIMGFRYQDAFGYDGSETALTLGLSLMVASSMGLIAQFTIVQRANLQPFTLLRLAIPIVAVGFGLLAWTGTLWVMFLAMGIQGFGLGLAGPGFTSGASLAVSGKEQGAVAGLIASCGPLGATAGPIFGGYLYTLSPSLPFIFSTLIYIILFFVVNFLAKRIR